MKATINKMRGGMSEKDRRAESLAPRRLLIIACSATKQEIEINEFGRQTAFDLYDGAGYRMIKSFMREAGGYLGTDVLIVSAEYGVISAYQKIANYERRMSGERAQDQREENQEILRGRIQAGIDFEMPYAEIFIWAGEAYATALGDAGTWNCGIPTKTVSKGRGIGDQKSELKRWLRNEKAIAA